MAKRVKFKQDNPHIQYFNSKGEEIPSVTNIIKVLGKESLIKWSNWIGLNGNNYDKYMEKVAYIGTCVHNIIECRLLKKKYELCDARLWFSEVPPYISQFDDFFKKDPFEPIKLEDKMVSDKFGGTCDCYCLFRDKKTILDYKTSKGVYMTMFLQLAGYIILKELEGEQVEQVGILTVNKDKCYVTLKTRKEMDKYIAIFNKLIDIFYGLYDLSQLEWKGNQ